MKFFLSAFLVMFLSVLGLPSLGLAGLIHYEAYLYDGGESPPNASPGIGSTDVYYDDLAHTLLVQVTFSGLLGTTTASHIHAATATPGSGNAIVATTTPTFPGFPLGVTSGTYVHTLDLTDSGSWNPAFITAHGGTPASAESFFIPALNAREAYLNIHTTFRPGGEIRGFLVAPIPASILLFGTGLAGLAGCRFRKKK